jgi:predicted small metal-binding protein
MTSIDEGKQRIAYCECGARLAGNSEQELFDAVQQHLAHHHPRLLGALGVETVNQMAEALGGH